MPDIQLSSNRWRLTGELKEGGFAKVYAADALGTEPIAGVVKFIPKSPGAERELLFEDLTGSINVIPILDSGEDDAHWFIAMPRAEYSLRDYIEAKGGKLGVDEAVQILIDVARGLASINGKVVHRDIKPENILFWNGSWCLADFGIARYADAATGQQTHKHYFTAEYASPEQWRGEHATAASDIYSTGITAFELFMGERPFQGPDMRREHLEAAAPELTGVPSQLSQLVQECLYKAAQARPTPQNLLSRLEAAAKPIITCGGCAT